MLRDMLLKRKPCVYRKDCTEPVLGSFGKIVIKIKYGLYKKLFNHVCKIKRCCNRLNLEFISVIRLFTAVKSRPVKYLISMGLR